MTVKIYFENYTSITKGVIAPQIKISGGEKYVQYYSDIEHYTSGNEPIMIPLDDDTHVEIVED